MNPTDRDLTLRALHRLGPAEARDLEARLADDPASAAALRNIEDTITAVWHAASPLRPAPTGTFAEIQAKLHPVRSRPALPITLAAIGWAAALALLAVLLNRPDAPQPVAKQTPSRARDSPADPIPASPSEPVFTQNPSEARLRETIRRLQESLVAARGKKSGPRIRELRPPGSIGHSLPDDQGRALLELLKATLAENLARRTEAPASLIVETGWLESAFAALPAGSVIRHRTFPEENFADYGLLRSAEGEFYDPVADLLWAPAQDGGGYLGHSAPTDLDHSRFESTPGVPQKTVPPKPAESATPSGYLVQGETGDGATVIIGNLPAAGSVPQLVASTDGGVTTIPLTSSGFWPGLDGSGFGTFSVPNSIIGNTSTTTSLGNFSILQSHPDGSWTVILTESP